MHYQQMDRANQMDSPGIRLAGAGIVDVGMLIEQRRVEADC